MSFIWVSLIHVNFSPVGGKIPLVPLILHDVLFPTLSTLVLEFFSDLNYLCSTAVSESVTLAKGADFINRCRDRLQAISIQTRVRIEKIDPQKRERVQGWKNNSPGT